MDFEFVMYHVGGGSDDIGPPEQLIKLFPKKVRLIVFEARSDDKELEAIESVTKGGVKKTSITSAIDENHGVKDFYVNCFEGLSSSLLPPSPLSIDEDPGYSFCKTWGENTTLEKKIQVYTRPIDEIIKSTDILPPDFLSIDVQGAELRVQKGAINALKNSILGLVTEVEFFEIYKDQCLFSEQFDLLGREGFRFVQLFSQQAWYPGPRAGKGFLTVGEALFFKYVIFDENVPTEKSFGCIDAKSLATLQFIKLAMISYSFRRYSYFYKIMEHIELNFPHLLEEIEADSDLSRLIVMYNFMKINLINVEKDPNFFLKNIKLQTEPFG